MTLEAIFVLLETSPEVPPHREEPVRGRWKRDSRHGMCRGCGRAFQRPGSRAIIVQERARSLMACARCYGVDPQDSAAHIAAHARSNP